MKVLFVKNEAHLRVVTAQTYGLEEVEASRCSDANAALSKVNAGYEGVIVTDIRMTDMDAIGFLAEVHKRDPGIPVILLTGPGDVELAVKCMKQGAYDVLEKPCEPARLIATVARASELRKLAFENKELHSKLNSPKIIEARLTGRSKIMHDLRRQVAAFASVNADILIHGATGTGKEVCARTIHRVSNRAQKPFVLVNCAALPEALMENELFGSEAGAFPGAMSARVGRFEHARGGVLCLDEIDSLSIQLQAKLLDVLHNRQVTRLGSNDAIPLDIRVIALAKTYLEDAVAKGAFRADLLYRLNVVSLALPPLADRREDVPGLFTIFAREVAERYTLPVPWISPAQLSQLAAHDWSGNIRELRNAAERFVLGLHASTENAAPKKLADQVAAYEKSLIAAAISANGGKLKETHKSLGLSRKALYDKMRKHGLAKSDFVSDA
ncbi:MAG: sigma-54 dependent transcriptional regulator [Roseibium sp.]|uniref:sigma-54-dependent transcriptional regulator n=1 Tax=Roseibium sp. TaxID=1936156 RepID=UPI0026272F0A|nr:sigma-54 dependent transcriptional regulator [Roseibium sp.]MCV0428246.1 sigma-54 dependent transcriptional regulator [Roseibium sp.]